MLRLEGLYGASSASPANTRGGTSWQQQYAGRMPTAPGGPMSTPNAPMASGGQWVGSAGRLGAPGTVNSGLYRREVGAAGNPNTQQASPQAQALFEEMRRRAATPGAHRMAQDRGVFSGGQQAAQMPGLPNGGRLAALYGAPQQGGLGASPSTPSGGYATSGISPSQYGTMSAAPQGQGYGGPPSPELVAQNDAMTKAIMAGLSPRG